MDKLFNITDQNIAYVRKYFEVTEESVKRDINILKQWMKSKEYLPQIEDDEFFENILLRSKFRINVAKKKIENYFNYKLSLSGYCKPHHFVPSAEVVAFIPVLKLTPSHERVFIIKLRNLDPEAFDFEKTLNSISTFGEVLIRKDYFVSNRVIIDASDIGFGHYRKITPTLIYKAQCLFLDAYSARVASFHILNASTIITLLLGIVKAIIRTKLFKKIIIHKSYDELYEHIPKEFIPTEYGGTLAETQDEILSVMDAYFSQHKPQIDKWLNLKAIKKVNK